MSNVLIDYDLKEYIHINMNVDEDNSEILWFRLVPVYFKEKNRLVFAMSTQWWNMVGETW